MTNPFDDEDFVEIAYCGACERHEVIERGRPIRETGLAQNEEPIFQLSPIEVEMLRLASEGFVDKKAALRLQLDPDKVHERWRRIRNELCAKTRSHAVAIAMSIGIIPPPEKARKILADRH